MAAALLATCAALTGCGGAGGARPRTGAELFAQACGACHSLTGTESPGRQGGDLLRYRFSRAVMLEFAREMPVRRPLDARELSAVTDYVTAVERQGRAR